MARYENAGNVKAGAGMKRPPLPVGDYPELMIEECREWDGQKRGHHYYGANLEVLTDGAPAPKGEGGTFMVQDEGNEFSDHDVRAIGQIKDFLGCALGLKTKPERTAKIGGPEIVASYENGGLALAGHVVGAKVSHTITKAGHTISLYEFRPVLNADGTPKVVQRTAAPAAPAPAAPAAPPAADAPPAGWVKHPAKEWADKGWFYNPAAPQDNPRQFPGF
jgi:hypothetical protein